MYRRFDEDYVDSDLPEMKRVYLEGRLGFANAFGAGVADDKAVFPFVPAMIEHYLRERPILKNAPTHSLLDPETRTSVLDRLPEIVLKPREGYGAQGMLIGPEAAREDVDEAARRIKENPSGFVAQEFWTSPPTSPTTGKRSRERPSWICGPSCCRPSTT
jgi:carboxylate-amine ligase